MGGVNMLTEKDNCDYGTTVVLEELGFPLEEDYGGVYIKSCGYKRPSLYEAQKFLREEKKLHITIYSQSQESWQYRITKPHQKLEDGLHGEDFSSYEEALLEGIKEAIKILKEK